ncbi:phophatdylinositol 4-kinase [Chlorella sorokiniana]|uniref:1-phosphatidylinositol 4-kinase n=1 Tax=Chlorella sorokiniana TaxID=3076 RepID=A0A2P6TQN4_CHLSO|nr:phophatdylinositol 4-kinase [Chlorella sorokiniana]|eukprot:PRW56340.1 phophatdylinositol 4-kinase [Chlorella sorokiniana]
MLKRSSKDKQPQAPGGPGTEGLPKGSDLLIRFFESDWFDTFIALTYLYKSQSAGVRDYLCNRLYGLPEREVERYLSQLTQLCFQRPGSSLERVIIDLCAQSLRIAVKTYWLLLAISQDQPKNTHVAALRDACEQAALEGHWQLPFKQSRLPAPLGSPTKRPGGLSPVAALSGSVEGLLVGSPPPDLRLMRQQAPRSPHASQGALLEGPGHPLLPARGTAGAAGAAAAGVDSRRVSSLQEELGAGEGVSALLLRSSTAGEGGGPGVVQTSEGAPLAGTSTRSSIDGGAAAAAAAAGAAAQLLSPPSSPRRRQTTFGATLDFVETLCQASSSLTAFQPEDRQWALRRALQQINAEIEKASRNGVAIWFPMGEANLRVVRLAPRESRLLNSREKAPFTLCVEVLDEEEAAVAIEARAAAAAAAANTAAAAALRRAPSSSGGSGSYADSALSLGAGDVAVPAQLSLQPFGEDAAAAAAAAAAEAAANGIQYLANHHRTVSMDTALLAEAASYASAHSRDSSMDAAALAAVQGSSAVTGDAAAAATSSLLAEGSEVSDNSVHSGRGLAEEPSFAGMLAGGEPASPAVQRRLTDELDAVSDEPSSSSSLRSSASPPCLASLTTSPVQPRPDQQPPAAQLPRQAPQQLPPLVLPQSPKQVGAGTWIGRGSTSPVAATRAPRGLGSLSPIPASSPVAAGGSKRRSSSQGRVSGSLDAALAGLRGEAPLVSVRLEVINDKPLSSHSARSSGSCQAEGQAQQQQGSGTPGTPDSATASAATAAVSSAERRRASLDAATRAPPHVCDRSSWACRLGLCKLCNTTLATVGDEEDAPWMQPYVRLHLTIQGGVDLSIKRTPGRHQRMPSHEAILKVAKQHKLPPPVLSAPQQQTLAPPQRQGAQQQAVAPAAEGSRAKEPEQQEGGGEAAAAVLPGSAPRPCLPVFRPASASASPRSSLEAQRRSEEEVQRQAADAAAAAYGEPWQARKERVQAASPHGRRPGWDLRCVIVKTGDDCRQELLAMQLIRTFHDIFAEAQLPLWLKPFEVLPTSSRTALIEMVPNAPSIHALKSKSPPGTSLREHLAAKCGGPGAPAFQSAQRAFVESLAAYSLVCYLLQIKDRHNGNILLDDEGHLIHIDFGFMLSNSPGGVNFESAPFKLTRELLEVMDSDSEGRASELFDYFKVLTIQGFLAVRKHADRILLLVEMMQGSGCPCFKSRVAAVEGLRKRFHLALPEPQVVEVVLGLISDSLDAWRTRQYDYYQRVLNGIL